MNESIPFTVYDIAGAIVHPEYRKLAELSAGKIVLEVGSQHGGSTVAMAQVAKQVIAVDWHQGDEHASKMDTLAGFWENLKRYHVLDRVIPIVGLFEDVAPLLASASFDLAFIDGQHHYDDCLRHCLLALRLLKPDGWFAVHDYGYPPFPSVAKVVDLLSGEKPIVLETLAMFPAVRAWEFVRWSERVATSGSGSA